MKKNTIIYSIILAVFIARNTLASATSDLQRRLDKINGFHANFVQKVTDRNGYVVQENQGNLSLKRLNLFNYHITRPNEAFLISDGKTLWFYNPYIKQATATWLKDVTDNTPLVLIARNQSSDWQRYDIKQNGDNFILTPKESGNIYLKKFTINISRDGTIRQFSIFDYDDQQNSYEIKSQKNNIANLSEFTFIPPDDVMIDDQRN